MEDAIWLARCLGATTLGVADAAIKASSMAETVRVQEELLEEGPFG